MQQAGFQFEISNAGICNPDLAQYAAIMVLASHPARRYSESEVEKVYAYVASGGGLVLIGDNPSGAGFQHLDTLAFRFGMDLSSQPSIASPYTFAPHPIFNNVASLNFQDGGAIVVSPPATAIAWSSSSPAVAVAEIGNGGRVVGIGDLNVWQDGYATPANLIFAKNVFSWVTHAAFLG